MWVYSVAKEKMYHATGGVERLLPDPVYSGYGEAKNDPSKQQLPGLGPIPQGVYWIGAEREQSDAGPVVLPLTPLRGTEVFGRGSFEIHGDSREHPGGASHGCIILPRKLREQIADSQDKLLVVLAGMET